MTKLTIEERYGFQIIDTPELNAKFAPIVPTDEFFDSERNKFASMGVNRARFLNGYTYRRRISVGEGFELVPLDEPINDAEATRARDLGKWYSPDSDWYFIKQHKTVRDYYEQYPEMDGILAFRRRKSPSSGWIKVETELPTDATKNVALLRADGCRPEVWTAGWIRFPSDYMESNYTHWQYLTLPEPPKPEKSAEELAFEKAVDQWKDGDFAPKQTYKHFFDAGVSFAKKKGGQ